MNWQPASTAPKDRPIMVLVPDMSSHAVLTAKWVDPAEIGQNGGGCFGRVSFCRRCNGLPVRFTHWMDIPSFRDNEQ